MFLAPVLLVPILGLWLLVSRSPRLRRIVGLVLFLLIGIVFALILFFPRALLEIALGGLLLAVAVVAAGVTVERRRLGRPRERRVRTAIVLVPVWVVLWVCCGAVIWRPAPFFPDTDRVLPLPQGLQAAVGPRDAGNCGAGSCSQTITVAGRQGQSVADLTTEVKRHLQDRGWGHGCRRAGWLLDRTTECVEVGPAEDGRVSIVLSGNRDDVAHVVTLD